MLFSHFLSDLELSELLARRKKIYETLHPATIARNLPGQASRVDFNIINFDKHWYDTSC